MSPLTWVPLPQLPLRSIPLGASALGMTPLGSIPFVLGSPIFLPAMAVAENPAMAAAASVMRIKRVMCVVPFGLVDSDGAHTADHSSESALSAARSKRSSLAANFKTMAQGYPPVD